MTTPRLHYYNLGEGVTAFSTTRQGGYSEERYGEFNINRYCGDSEEAHHAICAIHAGWRGTVQRIVEKAVAKMAAVYSSRPCDLTAQIGPGINSGRIFTGVLSH